jgi:hypothetical protein
VEGTGIEPTLQTSSFWIKGDGGAYLAALRDILLGGG